MSSFQDRQKSLFNHLKDAEDQYSFSKSNKVDTPPDYGTVDRHIYRKLKHEMKQFRGKESIYKRQVANIRECLHARKKPDFIENPQKWQYYSLSDVTPDQMSDTTNTATALAFLREMEDREMSMTKAEQDMEGDTVFKKPTFRISVAVRKDTNPEDENVVFKSNKIIMPEYVVGVTPKKNKKAIVKKVSKADTRQEKKVELKLGHLYEEED